jgi:dolichol-phosphate mannosyltransferase
MKDIYISIVSPVYQGEKLVERLVNEIEANVLPLTPKFEIILVDDGSSDESWKLIRQLAGSHERIIGIKLSRNFGQHYAISAGLEQSIGKWVVVIDCDLQDRPSEIPKLLTEASKGYDLVQARRLIRNDGVIKRASSKSFYWILSWLTGQKHDPSIANFGIYHRKVIDAVCSMREQTRYFPTMVKWVGFRRSQVVVEHNNRDSGKSTYNFRRLFKLALDIFLANSEKPIRGIAIAGFCISAGSFIIGLVVLIRYLMGRIEVLGYTSLIISIWFVAGMIMMMLGIVGLYVGKTFQAVKSRPVYIIEEKVQHDENRAG